MTWRATVAMITRDRCRSMLRTLDRLAALPERPPVAVVDNGSADATVAALARTRWVRTSWPSDATPD